jgi:Ca-activated chloride channel family protein
MYQWEHPEWLWALCGLPLLWLVAWLHRRWRRRIQHNLAEGHLLGRLAPQLRNRLFLKNALMSLAYTLVVLALANPRMGTRVETIRREGADLVFAVDVSNSMLAQDVPAGRMEQARQVVGRILDQLVADRVGMVVYAGKAYVQLPLTTDYAAARMFLRGLNTGVVSAQGTALAAAIEESATLFDPAEARSRIIFLVTDGEDHEAGYQQALARAREMDIAVVTIAIGTPQGAPVPEMNGNQIVDYKRTPDGAVVISKTNTDLLKQLAADGNGSFVDGNRTANAVEQVNALLEDLQRTESESRVFTDYESGFQWLLLPAIVLLLIDIWITERSFKP